METAIGDDRRLQIAADAYEFIDSEVRPFLAAGGRLWSKGSRGYPSRLRRMLEGLEGSHSTTFATIDAMRLDLSEREVEHVTPVKRIVIEIVDPRQADPRSNTVLEAIAGGPATSPQHLIEIFDKLLVTCWVTANEHILLNRAGRSLQWDAPDGDGWRRYEMAGVVAYPLTSDRIQLVGVVAPSP
jgi:hypothetical protein